MFDISGRHALVTGGTSGIGAAIAGALAGGGLPRHRRRAAAHRRCGGFEVPPADRLPPPALDVTDDDAVDRLVGGLNRLDILVNAAGIIRRGAEHDLETFSQVVDINLNGAMRVSVACRQLLAERGGSLVISPRC